MIHKYFHKSTGTFEQFIKNILLPYLAGYFSFRRTGKWFKEDAKGNRLTKFRNSDLAFLEKVGFKVRIDKPYLKTAKTQELMDSLDGKIMIIFKGKEKQRKRYARYVKAKQ